MSVRLKQSISSGIEYKVATSNDPEAIQRIVQELLTNGWEPQGGLSVSGEREKCFCQAVVRKIS